MGWTTVNPVQAGETTDRSQYDALWENVQFLANNGNFTRLNAKSDTNMVFGDATAPFGWIREGSWQDGAMLVYASAGDLASGGSYDPRAGHRHPSSLTAGNADGGHTHDAPATSGEGDGIHDAASVTIANATHEHEAAHFHGMAHSFATLADHIHRWYDTRSGSDDLMIDSYDCSWGEWCDLVQEKDPSIHGMRVGTGWTLHRDAYTTGRKRDTGFSAGLGGVLAVGGVGLHNHTLTSGGITDDHTHTVNGTSVSESSHNHSVIGTSGLSVVPSYQEIIVAYRQTD